MTVCNDVKAILKEQEIKKLELHEAISKKYKFVTDFVHCINDNENNQTYIGVDIIWPDGSFIDLVLCRYGNYSNRIIRVYSKNNGVYKVSFPMGKSYVLNPYIKTNIWDRFFGKSFVYEFTESQVIDYLASRIIKE